MQLEKLVNEEQDSPNLIVAKGKSKFDTYALMFHSLANVSFGSSTAIEGILLKRNSYLIGRAIYDNVVKINHSLILKIVVIVYY